MSDSVRPHRWQPTRLPRPWNSPGKNTGVGCHFLLQCMKVQSESEVAQSCPTLVTPWTAAHQAPPSIAFSRQEYWSGERQISKAQSSRRYRPGGQNMTTPCGQDEPEQRSTEFRLCGQRYFPEDMMPQLDPKGRSYHREVMEKGVPKRITRGKSMW